MVIFLVQKWRGLREYKKHPNYNFLSYKVCRLKRLLYRLKQSPRAWSSRCTRIIKQYGYLQCQANHTLFIKCSSQGRIVILIVYMNDIILAGDHMQKISTLKNLLPKEFKIKGLESQRYFIGIESTRSNVEISISQRKYVLGILKETRMLGCEPTHTPMDKQSN